MGLLGARDDGTLTALAVAYRWRRGIVRFAKKDPGQWDQFLRETFGPEGGSTLIGNPNKDGKKDHVTLDWALESNKPFRGAILNLYESWKEKNPTGGLEHARQDEESVVQRALSSFNPYPDSYAGKKALGNFQSLVDRAKKALRAERLPADKKHIRALLSHPKTKQQIAYKVPTSLRGKFPFSDDFRRYQTATEAQNKFLTAVYEWDGDEDDLRKAVEPFVEKIETAISDHTVEGDHLKHALVNAREALAHYHEFLSNLRERGGSRLSEGERDFLKETPGRLDNLDRMIQLREQDGSRDPWGRAGEKAAPAPARPKPWKGEPVRAPDEMKVGQAVTWKTGDEPVFGRVMDVNPKMRTFTVETADGATHRVDAHDLASVGVGKINGADLPKPVKITKPVPGMIDPTAFLDKINEAKPITSRRTKNIRGVEENWAHDDDVLRLADALVPEFKKKYRKVLRKMDARLEKKIREYDPANNAHVSGKENSATSRRLWDSRPDEEKRLLQSAMDDAGRVFGSILTEEESKALSLAFVLWQEHKSGTGLRLDKGPSPGTLLKRLPALLGHAGDKGGQEAYHHVKSAVAKAMAWTQTLFDHHGVEALTLWRGTRANDLRGKDGKPPSSKDHPKRGELEVQMPAALLSYSSHPAPAASTLYRKKAENFVVEKKVPPARAWLGPHTWPSLGDTEYDEEEWLVLDGNGLPGEYLGRYWDAWSEEEKPSEKRVASRWRAAYLRRLKVPALAWRDSSDSNVENCT